MRKLNLALWALVILAGGTALWFRVIAPRYVDLTADMLGHGDYALQTTTGAPFTDESLTGAASAVFFGFTHCPDVCPTTLGDIYAWQEELAKEGQSIRTFFFSVDPERDTPELLADYVGWVPGAVGVTGSLEEMQKALTAFRIYAQKVETSDGDYTMNHSAQILLFDRNGRFVVPVAYQEETGSALAKIREALAR